MKRNRLIKSSKRNSFLSEKKNKRSLLTLPFLALGGIFITSIVLATSKPASNGNQSQVIDLPNLPAEMQQQSSSNVIALPEQNKTITPIVSNAVVTPQAEQISEDLGLLEQNQIDKLALSHTPEEISAESPEWDWQEEKVKSGDNLSKIFMRVGLSARDVYKVSKSEGNIKPLLNLKPGQLLRFGIATDSENNKQLKQVELKISEVEKLVVSANEDSSYSSQTEVREIEKREQYAVGQIQSSLFEAGLLAGLSDELIMELAYIFGWDIDFALDLRQGDSFKLVYEENYIDGEKFEDGDILAAEFTNRGKTFKAIRYTDSKGDSHYFAPDGESMRKAFNRTPVHFSRISSKFNPNRLHPVLKTSRPHRGVDYAAARGTPIMATGDGKVSFLGTKGGYGRTIVLSHGGKYTTLYAHMSRYKKGLKRGQRVKQGQTIGYIGSSGLATGPHLHYEFRVNGVHRNPLTISLPHAKPLANKYMADFTLKSEPLLAQLATLNNSQLVLKD